MGGGSSKVSQYAKSQGSDTRNAAAAAGGDDDAEADAEAARRALSHGASIEQKRAALRGVWGRIDADRSGSLDEGEVTALLQEMDRDEDAAAVIQKIGSAGGVSQSEFETWFFKQDISSQVGLASVKAPKLTDVYAPHVVTRSGPTLIGKSAAAVLLARRSSLFKPATVEPLWDECWSKESTEVWFQEGEPQPCNSVSACVRLCLCLLLSLPRARARSLPLCSLSHTQKRIIRES